MSGRDIRYFPYDLCNLHKNCVTTSFVTLRSNSFVHISASLEGASEHALDPLEFLYTLSCAFSSRFIVSVLPRIPLSAGQNILRFCGCCPPWFGNGNGSMWLEFDICMHEVGRIRGCSSHQVNPKLVCWNFLPKIIWNTEWLGFVFNTFDIST